MVEARNQKVLLGIGDEELAWRIHNWLRAEGYRLIEARSGAQVLARAIEPGADLVLLDGEVTGIAAIDVCRYLRSQFGTRFLPIVVLCLPQASANYRSVGASETLDVPVTREKLAATVSQWLTLSDARLERNIRELSLRTWLADSL